MEARTKEMWQKLKLLEDDVRIFLAPILWWDWISETASAGFLERVEPAFLGCIRDERSLTEASLDLRDKGAKALVESFDYAPRTAVLRTQKRK